MERLIPSKPDLWHGTPVAGEKLTAEQIQFLKANGRVPARIVFAKRYVDRGLKLPVGVEFHACPMLSRTRDGKRVLVISPSGLKHWTADFEWRHP